MCEFLTSALQQHFKLSRVMIVKLVRIGGGSNELEKSPHEPFLEELRDPRRPWLLELFVPVREVLDHLEPFFPMDLPHPHRLEAECGVVFTITKRTTRVRHMRNGKSEASRVFKGKRSIETTSWKHRAGSVA